MMKAPRNGRTLVDKIWDSHVVATSATGECLLYVDRHFVHDGTSQAFERLYLEGLSVRSPQGTHGTADHYVPTRGGVLGFNDPARKNMVLRLAQDTARFGIESHGLGDPRQGIVHVVGPELGITLPGFLVVCGDSHTSTHGALGAFAFGVGATEVAHVLATQTLWQTRPKTMRIRVDGALGQGISAKDLILHIIATIGANGATGYAVEYAGPAIEALSIEARLTVCNMSIEAGARAGLVAPDEKTFAYIAGRPYAPTGGMWDQALEYWRTLKSHEDAEFDREVVVDAARVSPTVTWGTSPEDAVAVSATVPDPSGDPDVDRRERRLRALSYMDLRSRHADHGHSDRPRVHRFVHQQPHRGPSRSGRGPRGKAGDRPDPRGSGIGRRQGGGGSRGARQGVHRRGCRVARSGLFHVRGHERRRRRAAGRALRFDVEPQFRRPPGTGRANASDESEHGRGGGRHRTHQRFPNVALTATRAS